MARRCFISFKTEDIYFKNYIQTHLNVDMIDHSLDVPINSTDPDYIMRKIREDYLSNSTVTIHIIGMHSGESRGAYEQQYIKRELQASLYHGEGNTQNGILGVVIPTMVNTVYRGAYNCLSCGGSHTYVGINDDTVVKEFSYNYYIPAQNRCSWTEDQRFCVLVKWEDLIADPEKFIEEAFQKRTTPVANQTVVYP